MTNNITPLPQNNDQVLEQALSWLSELDRGLSPDREKLLKAWLQESAVHKNTFLEVAQLWDELNVLAKLSDIFPEQKKPKSWYKNTTFYPLAASIIVSISLVFYYFSARIPVFEPPQLSQDQFVVTYKTNIGEHKVITLPDHSVLTLNTDSTVSVNFSAQNRQLILDHGEVHVEVAHEEHRKFFVHAGGKVIQAVGTAFNVQHVNNRDIELIVTEGTVVVSEDNKTDPNNSLLSSLSYLLKLSDDIPLSVTAGEQVNLALNKKVKIENTAIETVGSEIDSKLSWMSGNLVFKGESLQQAITEISRYSEFKLELRGEKVKQVKIIGRFQTGDIELLLATLHKNFNINAQRSADRKIILTLANEAS